MQVATTWPFHNICEECSRTQPLEDPEHRWSVDKPTESAHAQRQTAHHEPVRADEGFLAEQEHSDQKDVWRPNAEHSKGKRTKHAVYSVDNQDDCEDADDMCATSTNVTGIGPALDRRYLIAVCGLRSHR